MITCRRTDSNDPDFRKLVSMLDAELRELDGEDHAFYAQFNTITELRYAVVAYDGSEPVGSGALKAFSTDALEVKRMFVPVSKRNKGIASIVLRELEKWTRELGYSICILETGNRQPDAIALYQKNGYIRIPNFGPYTEDANSVCFEKVVSSTQLLDN
jgi:GNAT superfamily N-acetyltransferase